MKRARAQTVHWDASYVLLEDVPPEALHGNPTLSQVAAHFRDPASPTAVSKKLAAGVDGGPETLHKLIVMMLERGLIEEVAQAPRFDRPLFIVSLPRAGSTLLFDTLRKSRAIWSIGDEAQHVFDHIQHLDPAKRGYTSMRALRSDCLPGDRDRLIHFFCRELMNSKDELWLDFEAKDRPSTIRFLDKTPRNSLRIPFLLECFSDARFIFLFRDPRENIASMTEGWLSNRYVTIRDLPGWDRKNWHFMLVEGWRDLVNKSEAEIAAFQWLSANRQMADDVKGLSREQWIGVNYADLIRSPAREIERVCRFANLPIDAELKELCSGELPLSRSTVTAPSSDKWRKYEADLTPLLPDLDALYEHLNSLSRG